MTATPWYTWGKRDVAAVHFVSACVSLAICVSVCPSICLPACLPVCLPPSLFSTCSSSWMVTGIALAEQCAMPHVERCALPRWNALMMLVSQELCWTHAD